MEEEKSKTTMSLLMPVSVKVTDGSHVERIEGRRCRSISLKDRVSPVNRHQPTADL